MTRTNVLGIGSHWLGQPVEAGGGGGGTPTSGTVIFGIAGQSNSIGRDGPIDAELDSTDASILMWDSVTEAFVTAADPLDHFDEAADTIGYGLTFAKAFKAAYSPTRIILVGMGEGGAGFLNGQWVSSGQSASVYTKARNRWEAAYAQAVTDYGSVSVGGLLWTQGEDEVKTPIFNALFDGAGQGKLYRTMPQTLFYIMRSLWTGWTNETPILVTSIPAASDYTGETSYSNIQTAISELPGVIGKSAYVDGTDLTNADAGHWDAASLRTLGTRLGSAYPTALAAGALTFTPASFTEDADNVSTPILIDARLAGDDDPVRNQGDGFYEFDNKRVDISGNVFRFDGDAELRWRGGATQKPRLADRDFVIQFRATHTTTLEAGIISDYQSTGDKRSFAVRYRSGDLQVYGSLDGVTGDLLLDTPWDRAEATFKIKRVGTSIILEKDGVQVDSYTGAYTFFDSGDDTPLLIGDHINSRELEGEIEYLAWEFLS